MEYCTLVHNFLENSATRLPDKVALICGSRRLTYQQINDQADQFARYLIDIGVRRQDRVIIFLDNSVESVISLFGILKAGAIFIILNPTMKAKKLNYILKDSGAWALITHNNKARIVKNALADIPELQHIVWCQKEPSQKIPQFDSGDLHIKTSMAWTVIFEQSSGRPLPHTTIDLDLATIIYTSGSTGEPKGVMSAHYNVIAAAKSITRYLENVEDDIILDTLPLSFDYGLYQILMAFLFGGTVVLEKSFAYPYKVIETLIQEKVTGFPIVPTMVAILLQMDALSKFNLSCLRYLTNTAAALPVAYIRKLQALFPHVKIYSMYGLTECKMILRYCTKNLEPFMVPKYASYLKEKFPEVTWIHSTVPLTSQQTGPKAWVKKLLGKPLRGYEYNIKRNRFNTLMRSEYEGKDPIFDLAKIESTLPDGKRESFTKDGSTYYTLVPDYTDDGSHLNETGRKVVAEQFLIFLANILE